MTDSKDGQLAQAEEQRRRPGVTPRMRKIMLEIDQKFGPFPTIGCYRPGDPQDHGSGRACDFMESIAGRMPTASPRNRHRRQRVADHQERH
ncbi:hypothetical protein ABZ806_22685 [Spirillospora sp. NPDC047418]